MSIQDPSESIVGWNCISSNSEKLWKY